MVHMVTLNYGERFRRLAGKYASLLQLHIVEASRLSGGPHNSQQSAKRWLKRGVFAACLVCPWCPQRAGALECNLSGFAELREHSAAAGSSGESTRGMNVASRCRPDQRGRAGLGFSPAPLTPRSIRRLIVFILVLQGCEPGQRMGRSSRGGWGYGDALREFYVGPGVRTECERCLGAQRRLEGLLCRGRVTHSCAEAFHVPGPEQRALYTRLH